MAKDTSAKCRQCRREGQKLFLKGTKCFTAKCPIEKRNNVAPGVHGAKRGRLSDFAVMLREKQKIRRIYGVLENQFKKYYEEANRRKGATGEMLLQLLESRLDNVAYRLGFGLSRSEARQVVLHRGVKVNGQITNIPSYTVKQGDIIELTDKAKEQLRTKFAVSTAVDRGIPSWLDLDSKHMVGTFKNVPDRSDLPSDIQEHLVVEYYSK